VSKLEENTVKNLVIYSGEKMWLRVQRHAVAQLVEVLRYKSEGRWFDSRWCH
jgi:hypothetical protein